jgi:hypothetical protein
MAEETSRRSKRTRSANIAVPISRPNLAKVLPLKKRNGARAEHLAEQRQGRGQAQDLPEALFPAAAARLVSFRIMAVLRVTSLARSPVAEERIDVVRAGPFDAVARDVPRSLI